MAALVEELAARDIVQSSHVGPMGGPSQTYELYRQLAASSSRAQMLALLRHKSPVVRGYVAQFFVGESGDDLAALSPLFDDDTTVQTQNGCRVDPHSMCELVLARVSPARVAARLQQVTRESRNFCRMYALKALAALKDPTIRPIAEPLLFDKHPGVVCMSIRSLATLGAAESAATIRELASSANSGIREEVATALSAWPTPESEAVLRSLMEKDESEFVRGFAAKSYLRQPGRDLKWVQARRRSEKEFVRLYIEMGLAHDGRPDSLALLQSLLVPRSQVSESFWIILGNFTYRGDFPSPAFIEFLRKLRPPHAPRELVDHASQFLRDWESTVQDPATPFR
jgi:hypothetical protein